MSILGWEGSDAAKRAFTVMRKDRRKFAAENRRLHERIRELEGRKSVTHKELMAYEDGHEANGGSQRRKD